MNISKSYVRVVTVDGNQSAIINKFTHRCMFVSNVLYSFCFRLSTRVSFHFPLLSSNLKVIIYVGLETRFCQFQCCDKTISKSALSKSGRLIWLGKELLISLLVAEYLAIWKGWILAKENFSEKIVL